MVDAGRARLVAQQPSWGFLRVFDVNGRLVASVYEGRLDAGPHSLEWPGVDDAGTDVSAGLYFARMEASDRTASGKILVLR